MSYIKEKHFHIKGTPRVDEVFKTCTNNYAVAALGYEKGRGYYWRVSREGRYTVRDERYGEYVMCAFTLGDDSPYLKETIIPCSRSGKARERQAVELFDSNITQVVINLGYDVEEDDDDEED